ncbi:hypothetical protein HDF26_001272 [Pedobacter cryoconitis]|nr:hypothetical protein [Pedobacter cryoconitis]
MRIHDTHLYLNNTKESFIRINPIRGSTADALITRPAKTQPEMQFSGI